MFAWRRALAGMILVGAVAGTPAGAQTGSGGKYSPTEVVGCLVTVNELIRAGRIANLALIDRLAIVVIAAAYEHETIDVTDDIGRRFLALHDELWAAADALPEASRLDVLARRLTPCGEIMAAVDAGYQAMLRQANEEMQRKVAAARASFLDAQYDWLQSFMTQADLYRDDGATRAYSHSWSFNSRPDRFHLEIGVAADPRSVTEEMLVDRFCPSQEQTTEYCRLRPAATPLVVRVKKDREGKDVDGPLALCLLNSLKTEPGPEIDRSPDRVLSWPRFLWTPHCPLEPRRNSPHERQSS